MAKKKKAGRKPIEDKAVRLIIYPRQSWIKKVGANELYKLLMETAERAAKKKSK